MHQTKSEAKKKIQTQVMDKQKKKEEQTQVIDKQKKTKMQIKKQYNSKIK